MHICNPLVAFMQFRHTFGSLASEIYEKGRTLWNHFLRIYTVMISRLLVNSSLIIWIYQTLYEIWSKRGGWPSFGQVQWVWIWKYLAKESPMSWYNHAALYPVFWPMDTLTICIPTKGEENILQKAPLKEKTISFGNTQQKKVQCHEWKLSLLSPFSPLIMDSPYSVVSLLKRKENKLQQKCK